MQRLIQCDLRAKHWSFRRFSRPGEHIHGLTTADCTWLTACVGVVCGIAEWRVIFVGVPLVFAVLLLGGRIEEEIDRRWGKHSDDAKGMPTEETDRQLSQHSTGDPW
jgi:uncharacterized membrane protein YhiD involved in acid resistance